MKKLRIKKLAGICGVFVPIVIFISIWLAILEAPWFRWTHNALSDRGVEGASAVFFNNGIILGGLLAVIFSLGLAKTLSNKIGPYLLAISSLALIAAGLFPQTVFTLHYVSSSVFFVFLTIALFTQFILRNATFPYRHLSSRLLLHLRYQLKVSRVTVQSLFCLPCFHDWR